MHPPGAWALVRNNNKFLIFNKKKLFCQKLTLVLIEDKKGGKSSEQLG